MALLINCNFKSTHYLERFRNNVRWHAGPLFRLSLWLCVRDSVCVVSLTGGLWFCLCCLFDCWFVILFVLSLWLLVCDSVYAVSLTVGLWFCLCCLFDCWFVILFVLSLWLLVCYSVCAVSLTVGLWMTTFSKHTDIVYVSHCNYIC